MTREEAIIWCDRFNDAWANADTEDDFPDVKYSDKLDQLFYLAGKALRAQQEQERKTTTGEGLRCKYIVRKVDTGEGVDGCFVLRPDRDRAAVAALRAYASATDNDALATDILHWVGQERNVPLTLDELRKMDGEPVWIVWTDGRIKPQWWIVGNYDWDMMEFFDSHTASECGKKWLAYRQKPEEWTK